MNVLSLPAAAFVAVVEAVPLDTRLRCREVSPAWRAALDAATPLWCHIDLSDASGVTAHVSPALLRAASRRAGACAQCAARTQATMASNMTRHAPACVSGGAAVSLDLSVEQVCTGYRVAAPKATDQRLSVKLADVLSFIQDNRQHLRRVSITFLWLFYSDEPGWAPEWAHYELSLEDTRKLALAAPDTVIVESNLSAVVTDQSFDTPRGEMGEPSQHVAASVLPLLALFRQEPPFANVRLRSVNFSGFHFSNSGDQTRAFCDFCAVMAQHRWLTSIRFHGGFHCAAMARNPADDRALSAFVDAALSLPALRDVEFCYMTLPSAPLPQLARLLRGAAALQTFTYNIHDFRGLADADLLTGEAIPEFCAAIEAAPKLTQLTFRFGANLSSTVAFSDPAAGAAILAAARASPMLRCVKVNNITHAT